MVANDAKLTWLIDFKDDASLRQFSKIIASHVRNPIRDGRALFSNDIVRITKPSRRPYYENTLKIEIDVHNFIKRYSCYELNELTKFINDKLVYEIIRTKERTDND